MRQRTRLEDASRISRLLLLAIVAEGATLGGASAAVPVGLQFQVNSYTNLEQRRPAAAMEGNGDFVVVWQSTRDGASYDVIGQRFSSSGARLGVEFQVNSLTGGTQIYPSIGMDSDGDFVVAFQSDGQDGYEPGIFARRFSSTGAKLATEFQVNTYTFYSQSRAAVALDGDGDFVVVWRSVKQDSGQDSGVFGQRYSSSGAKLGVEFQVNTYTLDLQGYSVVAMSAAGDFVVAWQSQNQDGSINGIFARRFSSAGGSTGEFQVNTYTSNSQSYPDVAMDPDGDFVIVWRSNLQDGDALGLFARRFTSSAAPIGGELQVNVLTVGPQQEPSVAISGDGGFVGVWNVGQVKARAFSSTGAPLTAEFLVNTVTSPNAPRYPMVAMNTDGDFVVSWEDLGAAYDIFARRFVATATLDIDADGEVVALTDGLLALRWMFDFTGAVLIAGAVDGSDCTRCTAPSVDSYLASIESLLDIDDDGQVEPLTDGLLVLRWLFGFTGSTLVSGAVDPVNCGRCNAAAIEPYLATID